MYSLFMTFPRNQFRKSFESKGLSFKSTKSPLSFSDSVMIICTYTYIGHDELQRQDITINKHDRYEKLQKIIHFITTENFSNNENNASAAYNFSNKLHFFFQISVIPNIMLYVKIEGNMIQKTPCEFCGTTYFAPKSSAILIYEALYTFFKPLVFVPKR